MTTTARAYLLKEFGKPLVAEDLELPDPDSHEALIEVEACGMCHTDLGYAQGSVKPNHALPLALGHEVMGRVVSAGDAFKSLVGKQVVVPAVLPCLDCELCRAGRSNACTAQKMPGNDIHGGFATHMVVPAAPLVALENVPAGLDVRALSVVADAVSTAYQAILRARLKAGDIAYVIGAGGVGGFAAQIAHAMGAKVVTLDISEERLQMSAEFGADAIINVAGQQERDVRKQASSLAKGWGIGSLNTKIFECSGTAAGQMQAYTLLGRASTLVFVGYTFEKVNVRLSNLMAFDATAMGTWGCPPEAYPPVLALIFKGQVAVEPFVDYAPMSTLNEQLEAMAAHKLTKRMVLDPRN